MAIKTILLPLGESDTDEWLLDAALAAARRFKAHLDVLHVRADADALLPYATLGVSASMKETVREASEQSALKTTQALEQLVRQASKRHGVPMADRGEAAADVSVGWVLETGAQEIVVAHHGRLADLIIVPRPARVSPPPRTIEAALRETGRPVLMVPPGGIETLGEHVVIGWNGSKEAAQAVAAARTCLREASKVTVLTTEKRSRRPPSADDLIRYLACHGIEASTRIMDTSSRSVPEALLDDVEKIGADLLVLGGYSRSRLREMIIGGVTRHVLSKAKIPILMVH
jgi:nucleotide-binding universal stress UspA family protein